MSVIEPSNIPYGAYKRANVVQKWLCQLANGKYMLTSPHKLAKSSALKRLPRI